jgi:hypothetical protein
MSSAFYDFRSPIEIYLSLEENWIFHAAKQGKLHSSPLEKVPKGYFRPKSFLQDSY